MIKVKFKNANNELGISFVLETKKIKEKYSQVSFFAVSSFRTARDYLRFKFKLLRVLIKILGANPKEISLKEEGGETLLSISGEKGNETSLRKLPSTSCFKERIARGISLFLIFSLILQVCFNLGLPIKAQQGLCSFDVDVVLLADITKSMENGSLVSKCQWTELREIPEGGSYTHFLNKKYDITEDWCLNVRDSYDETSIHFTFVPPTYTPAVESKIVDAKESFKGFVDKLGPNDQSGLVSFDQTAVLIENLSDDFQAVKDSIDGLVPANTNTTNIGQAIEQANQELASERANPQALKTAILLTDGQDSNIANVNEKTQQAADLGHRIFTIGLGAGVNQTMLQDIADTTGGEYHYAAHQADLAGIFDQISQEICEFASLCQLNETAGQCVSDGQRERQFIWNYSYCGEDYTENFEDETCNCQAIEVSRACVDDNLTEVDYTYNFSFCGEDYKETKEDLSCGSEYQCSDWQSGDCVNDGIREETRTCIDQYENSYEESRDIADETCNCLAEETGRACSSDSYAEVNYSYNFNYCGQDYSQEEEDEDCGCVYTEWQDGECVDNGLRKQTRTQTSQFDFCVNLEKNVEDSSCLIDSEEEEEEEEEEENQEPAGGGGFIHGGGGTFSPPPSLEIHQDSLATGETEEESITVSWTTNRPATSRVVYDTVSHEILGEAPNYGYAYSTPEYDTDPKVTEHSVTITGLVSGLDYYWRVISRSSPEIISDELSFTFAVLGEETEQGTDEETTEEEDEISLEKMEQELEELKLEVELIKKELERISSEMPEVLAQATGAKEEIEQIAEEYIEETSAEEEFRSEEKQETVKKEGFLAAISFTSFGSLLVLLIVVLVIAIFIIPWLNRRRKK